MRAFLGGTTLLPNTENENARFSEAPPDYEQSAEAPYLTLIHLFYKIPFLYLPAKFHE